MVVKIQNFQKKMQFFLTFLTLSLDSAHRSSILLSLDYTYYIQGGGWVFRGLEIWPKFAGDFGDFEL